MKKVVLILGFLAIVFTVRPSAQINCPDPVSILPGQVRGANTESPGACVWRGIPFAAAPVGDLRWKAPHPVPAWSGVRSAEKFGPLCMQKGMTSYERFTSEAGMSEDCLYLNVWRPKKAGVFPVMVWIHGGGYTGGASSTPMYWGDRLAETYDVVVVSTNYRLNIFGFFASPELRAEDPNNSTGSYATLDQVAALQWVHDNIKNFGGDPNNVTIFGESAGGWSICTMVATPLAKGLFQRAILQSGGCEESEDLEKGYEIAKTTAEKLGCKSDDLKCLRAVPAKKVLNDGPGGMGMNGNMPHHDGYALTGTPLSMIKSGNFNKVPFMAGSTRDEFGKATKLIRSIYHTRPKDYEKRIKEFLKLSDQDAAQLVSLYPLSEFDNRPVEAYGRMMGVDMALACPTYQGLLAASKQETPAYYYRFDYDNIKLGRYIGAVHSIELPFIFDSFDRLPYNAFFNDKNIASAEKLGKVMQGYWVNFAKTGNPNGAGLQDWPAFTPDARMVKIFDDDVRTEKSGIGDRCEFWEKHPMKERPSFK